jgi:hypothetical protein
VNIGESGLEVSEPLGGGSACGVRGRRSRRLGWRAAAAQSGADFALCQVEPNPDAMHGPIARRAADGAAGGRNAADYSGLEKPPEGAGAEAKPSDFVGEPDAEGPPTTRPRLAVAAKDPPGAYGLLSRAGLVKTAQEAMPDQCADGLAVWTRNLLDAFRKRRPLIGAAAKPSLLTHRTMPPKRMILPGWGGVKAGYD